MGRERKGVRKIASEMLDAWMHARTHAHKGDFILCPMLCIALDEQKSHQSYEAPGVDRGPNHTSRSQV